MLAQPDLTNISKDFEALGVKVIQYKIDVDGFNDWLEQVQFPSSYIDSYGGVFVEKALEHYVGASLLQMRSDDMLIDVAAAHSPWYEMARRLYGCDGYALDLVFPSGVHGKKIGADATHMPLPDDFATKITLHCSYEHFEGSADVRLISEAYRILKDGGKMIILPLYMHEFYQALSSPWAGRKGLDYNGAELVWWDYYDAPRCRFARNYSVEAFYERIVTNLNGFTLQIYYIENEKEVSPTCYLKFAALFEKPSIS
jgi:SAM-dependent methyltransferase